jgi:hypothetical protein
MVITTYRLSIDGAMQIRHKEPAMAAIVAPPLGAGT